MTTLSEKPVCHYVEHTQPAQTADCLERVGAANALQFALDTVGTLRARAAARQASFVGRPVAGVDVRDAQWGTSGQVKAARIYSPDRDATASDLALVWFHGGGFVSGSLDAVDYQCRLLCKGARIAVASFAYALAPEAPFPRAIEDALAAIAWAREQFSGERGRPPRIVVGGDSAGGNLAAVASQSLARFPLHNVAGQLLIYPVLDLHNESWSYATHATTPTLTAERMRWYGVQYAGSTARTDPRISPLVTSDLKGVAPALIISAEIDPLLGESETYADKLRQSGIEVERHVFRGLYHGFWNWGACHDAAGQASGIATNWLKRIGGCEQMR
jgi:acetyl esterase